MDKKYISVPFEGTTFDGGFRAPPWRQLHGDIAYITAVTEEGETVSITACIYGYHVNGGVREGNILHERTGDIYPNLVALLKKISNHFESLINSQVFLLSYFLRYFTALMTFLTILFYDIWTPDFWSERVL